MSEYVAGVGRPPFDPNGRLVARRVIPSHGGRSYQPGEEVPRLELTSRQVAILWDQYVIDTLPAKLKGKQADSAGKTG